jgi:hypothetical protein
VRTGCAPNCRIRSTLETIEEKMEDLQDRKRLTFDRIINRAGSPGDRSISTEDLKALLDADPG